jgi:purine-binding chemotaxis protein CheW
MAIMEISTRRALTIVPSGQLMTFTLDGVEFGLDIEHVQEITTCTDITPVPGAPGFILGIFNLRGSVIPVMDCRLRFRLPPRGMTSATRVIVLNLAGQPTRLLVDGVSEVDQDYLELHAELDIYCR